MLELTKDERGMLTEARNAVQVLRTTLIRITYLLRRIPGPDGWGEGVVRWNEQPSFRTREVVEKMLEGWAPNQPAVRALTPMLTAAEDGVRQLETAIQLLHSDPTVRPAAPPEGTHRTE